MTLSGGECFCQPEFTAALLRGAKERGISTAVESVDAPLERYRKRTALAGYLSDGYKTHESRET